MCKKLFRDLAFHTLVSLVNFHYVLFFEHKVHNCNIFKDADKVGFSILSGTSVNEGQSQPSASTVDEQLTVKAESFSKFILQSGAVTNFVKSTPKCMHGESAVERVVKKKGPNFNRRSLPKYSP